MEKAKMPKMNFEGPLGYFWSLNEIPMESIIQGIRELVEELYRRNIKDENILEMLKTFG